jgi:hypothetical protein
MRINQQFQQILDGNGRVARTILDFQTKQLLGHPLSRNIRREEYLEALSCAQGDGYLKPLAQILMRGELGVRRPQEQIGERRFGVGARGNSPDGLIVSKPRFVTGESEGRGHRR